MHKNTWCHRIGGAALAVLLGGAVASAADVDTNINVEPRRAWSLDVRGGVYADDVDGPMVGFGGLKRWGDGRWYFNPNIEAAFGDGIDLVTLNGDAHYDFRELDSDDMAFWAGFGPALVHSDPRRGDSDIDVGANLFVGLGAKRGNVRPFGQLKVLIADDSELVLLGGVRF